MIKNHKWKAIISSIVILLPILFGLAFWSKLPNNMVSHWGGDGVADGTAPKTFMVFGMPLILLALHWLCLVVTSLDKKSKGHSDKIVTLIYCLMPAASLVIHAIIYGVALEKEWDLGVLVPVLIGVMFLFIGNYLPKTTRNRTMGIKLRWTMGNDENWQKTHRLGGQLWFWGGLVILASALFSLQVAFPVMAVVIIASVTIPTVYSYNLYRKHRAAGIDYEPVYGGKSDKTALWITAIVVPLILIGVCVLMFTGDISVTCRETDFEITASYGDDLTVRYEEVDAIEYRESFSVGSREMGFGSLRISTGTFKNEEFGRYTLYAYTWGKGAVVLRKGDRVLVIVGKTAAETKAIYDSLAAKIA